MGTRRTFFSRLGVVAAVCIVSSCSQWCPSPSGTVVVTPPSTGMPECPHTWTWEGRTVVVEEREEPLTVLDPTGQNLSGPGPIQDIPEYHDCQRFLNEDGTQFGEFLAVFAGVRPQRLDTLALADSADHIPAGPLNPQNGLMAVPAAQIYAEQDYPPLNISIGFNCLYLYRDGGVWRAKMTSSGLSERDCFSAMDAATMLALPELDVLVRSFPWLRDTDYPRVARWDLDRGEGSVGIGEYSIRVGCGASECLIGPRGFQPENPVHLNLALANTGDPVRARVYAIEAWHDEQVLAMLPTAGSPPVPSGIVGTILPDPRIDQFQVSDYRAPGPGGTHWLATAYVHLPSVPPGYTEKFGLYATPGPSDFNTISLCNGAWDVCLPPGEAEPSCRPSADGEWWAKIEGPAGQRPVYRCIVYRQVTGIPIPPTVRWRWLVDDDGGWMRCPQGCCELS